MLCSTITSNSLHWRHNEHDGVSNHWHLDCLLSRLFSRRSKKTSKLCITGLCEGNPLMTGGFPSLKASNVKNVSICWCHHAVWTHHSFLTLPINQLWYIWQVHVDLASHDQFNTIVLLGRDGVFNMFLYFSFSWYQWFSARLQYLQC